MTGGQSILRLSHPEEGGGGGGGVTETYMTPDLHQIICFCTFSHEGVTSPLDLELKSVQLMFW